MLDQDDYDAALEAVAEFTNLDPEDLEVVRGKEDYIYVTLAAHSEALASHAYVYDVSTERVTAVDAMEDPEAMLDRIIEHQSEPSYSSDEDESYYDDDPESPNFIDYL